MNNASDFVYLKPKKQKKRRHSIQNDEKEEVQYLEDEQIQVEECKVQTEKIFASDSESIGSDEEMDTNVVGIDFDVLKNTANIAMGDPIFCHKCKSVLNKYSKILTAQEYLNIQKELQEKSQIKSKEQQQEDDFIMINSQGLEIEEHEKVWKCEFCNTDNKIRIETEEIPQNEDTVYILESFNQQSQQDDGSDFSIVFCLDNSGSMSVTSEIKGQKINLKHGISPEEYEMLKQFIDAGDEHQMMPGQSQKQTYVSRKQCVLAAIESQLSEMKKAYPNRKVGVVTFNDEVVVIGDGHSQQPLVITGDKLYKQEEIKQIAETQTQQLLTHTIGNSFEQITQKLDKIQEKGKTALGPALMTSLLMASKGKPGSMVVICTDGLSNIGLGSMDTDEELVESQKFYDELTTLAKQLGIVVSVITIKGEGCKIQILGKLADETNGTVTQVQPGEIDKQFAEILQDEIVGTKVLLEVQLHNALQFRHEDKQFIQENGSKFVKEIGNATIQTRVTFEYQAKSDEMMQKEKIDINQIKQIPLQSKIYYTTTKGDRYLRVLSQTQNATQNKLQAEQGTRVDVIHQRIQQQSANLLQQGRFKHAQKYNSKWSHYVNDNDIINSVEDNRVQSMQFKEMNHQFKKCANKKVQRANNKSQPMHKEKKSGGMLQNIKEFFSKGKQDSQEVQPTQQMQMQVQKQMCSEEIEEEEEEEAIFSASDDNYSSDEDKDEQIAIKFKKAKKK